jgi:hypothetical protein
MKHIRLIIPAFLLMLAFWGCKNLGKEKIFNGVQLYHAEGVSDTLANSLGNYLISSQFADGRAKTVQITKTGDTYHFRFVVKDGAEKDSSISQSTKYFASLLSADVFNGAPVRVEMCDNLMNTLKSFTSVELGKKKIVDGLELYHTAAVTDAQADSLGSYLVATHFADGKSKTAQIAKSGATYQFRFVINPGVEKDPEYIKNSKVYGADISTGVFGGAPVELHLCDKYLNTLLAVPMDSSAK